jgi:CubicO group peptidase (beta-lactamase class C family)
VKRAFIYLWFLTAVCTIPRDGERGLLFPGEMWEHEHDLREAGWVTDELMKLRAFLDDSSHTTGFMVIHRGKVAFEYGDVQEVSYIASCRKSVLALLYGPYVERGEINLDATLGQLQVDDIGGLLPAEKAATIRNLLTARSGIYHRASNPGDQYSLAPKRGSVVPGSTWLYNNWDFNVAGFILEQQTQQNIYDLVDSMLARPLQMQNWNHEIQQKSGDANVSKFPAYHMWFSTQDMARIGYLMLRQGNWKNRRIVSSAWINTITSPVTRHEEMFNTCRHYSYFGYGYMWWSWDNPENSGAYAGWYTAMGAFGQYITVFPKLDMVVVHKNNSMTTQTDIDTYLKILTKVIASRKQ